MNVAMLYHDVYEVDSRPFCPFIFVLWRVVLLIKIVCSIKFIGSS